MRASWSNPDQPIAWKSATALTTTLYFNIQGRLTVPKAYYSSKAQRLRQDRERLLKTLHDCEAGKIAHLEPNEQHAFVASLKRRIATLDEQIARSVQRQH
jgi:hypothetical protein